VDLTDIYRAFHPAKAQCTFFTAANETLSKIDHIIGHRASFHKDKKIEISPPYSLTTIPKKLVLNNKRTAENIQTHGDFTTHFSMISGSLKK
jgi:hypothetical protein